VRRAWQVAAAVALGVVPPLAWLGWRAAADYRTSTRAREAVGSLRACLLGDDVTAAGASARLRASQIGADLAKDETWPGRCEPYVTASERALARLHGKAARACEGACCEGDQACHELGALRATLVGLRDYFARGERSGFDAGELVALSDGLGLAGERDDDVPAAPAPARLLDPAAMTALYEGDYLRLLTDPAGDQTLDLLFYEEQRRYRLCRLDLGTGGTAACDLLPSTIPVGQAGELFAAERGAPAQMYAQGPAGGQPWVHALYDVESGKRLAQLGDRPRGGFVWREGSHARLEESQGESPAHLALHRLRDGHDEGWVDLAFDDSPSIAPRLVWDEIVWAVSGEDGERVRARRVLAGDAPVGEVVELGVTPRLPGKPSVEVCRTDEALVVLVGATDERGDQVIGTLFFRTAAGWQPGVDIRLPTSRFGFTCRGETATLSAVAGLEEQPDLSRLGDFDTEDELPVYGRYTVRRLRCRPGACQDRHAKLPLVRHSRASRYVAGDVGDKMVVLWRSPLGDVRMKLAELEELAEAPEVAIFDDVEHDGFDWDLERDPIVGRAGNVLVLMSRQIGETTDSATYGFRIEPSGAVEPVAVTTPEL
jgi:hypothetical protein